MKIVSKHFLFSGAGALILATAGLYGCKDFLSSAGEPQGTLDASTLATRDGVEGSLIATYRDLDCTNALPVPGGWGCAASNWVFGDVASDDRSTRIQIVSIDRLQGGPKPAPVARPPLDAAAPRADRRPQRNRRPRHRRRAR